MARTRPASYYALRNPYGSPSDPGDYRPNGQKETCPIFNSFASSNKPEGQKLRDVIEAERQEALDNQLAHEGLNHRGIPLAQIEADAVVAANGKRFDRAFVQSEIGETYPL